MKFDDRFDWDMATSGAVQRERMVQTEEGGEGTIEGTVIKKKDLHFCKSLIFFGCGERI